MIGLVKMRVARLMQGAQLDAALDFGDVVHFSKEAKIMDFSTAEGRGKSSNRPSVRLSVNSMLRRFIPNSKHRGTSTCGNGITVAFDLPEDVWVVELVHELHLLEHVGPVRAVLVHLEHHHLPRRLVRHLKQSRQESQ